MDFSAVFSSLDEEEYNLFLLNFEYLTECRSFLESEFSLFLLAFLSEQGYPSRVSSLC